MQEPLVAPELAPGRAHEIHLDARKNPYLTRLEEAMSNLIGPLQEQLAEVNRAIERKEQERDAAAARFGAELAEIREARRAITNTLRGINPDLAPSLYKKNGKKKSAKKEQGTSRHGALGQEKLDRLRDFLQEHRDELNVEGGFKAGMLAERYPEIDALASRAALQKALSDLHEQGILHLDRWVKGRATADGTKTPGKFFKVA
jgi:hypothetical protein